MHDSFPVCSAMKRQVGQWFEVEHVATGMEPVDLSLKSPNSATEINNNHDNNCSDKMLSSTTPTSASTLLLNQRLMCLKQLSELTNGVQPPDRRRAALMKPNVGLSFPAALLSPVAQMDELQFKKESKKLHSIDRSPLVLNVN